VDEQQVAAEEFGDPADDNTALSMTADECAAEMADMWNRLADASGQLAASLTRMWWKGLPVARPGGLDMRGSAAMLAARMARLGPEGDPVEVIALGSIAWAHGAQAQAAAQAEEIEQMRRELREFGTENDS